MFALGFILLAVFTIILGSWIILLKRRSHAGISGWVKDSDLKGKGKKYVDLATGMVAKPDVVLSGKVIEVKSYTARHRPFKGDILQAAAEMNAVGAGKAEIHYPNQRFLVKNTTQLRDSLMLIYQTMKELLELKIAPAGTPTKRKCLVCEFNADCPERI